VADSTGQLKAPVGNSDYVMPVGTASSYNPVTLNEAGTPDTFGVIFNKAMPGGWTGTDHAVTGNWAVTEKNAGGTDLTVTPQWNLADEQTNFSRADCAVGVSADNGATVAWKASGAASGPGPYYKDGAGFTGVGIFLVGDYFYQGIELDLDFFLAGPYSGGTMSTALNSIIPLTDPYGNGIDATSIPATAVDWIEVELRNKITPSTVEKSYSFFLDNGGNVLNLDGNVGAILTGILKDQYYVAVRHRNHLGAMTLSTIDFTTSGPHSFDFSAGTNIHGTNAMRDMGTNWALWAGNTNGNASGFGYKVIYQGSNNDVGPIGNVVSSDPGNTNNLFTYIVNGYYDEDVNMDGKVIYQGESNDVGPVGNSVSQHPGNTNNLFTYEVVQQLP
jgi:hypothetical protein